MYFSKQDLDVLKTIKYSVVALKIKLPECYL